MIEDLRKVIAAELGLTSDRLVDDRAIAEIPGWDSMTWINVVSALEEQTGQPFPIDNIDEVKTIGQLIRVAQSSRDG